MSVFFSKNLKFLRKKKGLTQEDLESGLELGKTIIHNYEKGLNSPSLETLCRIATFFEVSIDSLLLVDMSEKGTQHKGEKAVLSTIHANNGVLNTNTIIHQHSEGEWLAMEQELAANKQRVIDLLQTIAAQQKTIEILEKTQTEH